MVEGIIALQNNVAEGDEMVEKQLSSSTMYQGVCMASIYTNARLVGTRTSRNRNVVRGIPHR